LAGIRKGINKWVGCFRACDKKRKGKREGKGTNHNLIHEWGGCNAGSRGGGGGGGGCSRFFRLHFHGDHVTRRAENLLKPSDIATALSELLCSKTSKSCLPEMKLQIR
jgi:hypothetical protein